jgi:hypothetical protein
MAAREVRASGLEYLTLATALLQRARLAYPEAGVWEAADLQWWWRSPRRRRRRLLERRPRRGPFLREPFHRDARARTTPPTLSDEEFKRIATLPNLDKLVVAADAKQLTCQQLESLNDGILVYIRALIREDLRNGAGVRSCNRACRKRNALRA